MFKPYLLFLSKVKQHIFINLQSVSLRDTTPYLEFSKHLFRFPGFEVHALYHMVAAFYRPKSSLSNHNSLEAFPVGPKLLCLLKVNSQIN